MSTVQEEHVLVIPTELFRECGYFEGINTDTKTYLDRLLDPTNTSYRPRSDMESDPSFKQLIPYCIFQHTGDDGKISVFAYTRGRGQGEARLHSKRSVGIGGHISAVDQDALSVYDRGMQRELEEEIKINTPYSSRMAGLLNDDSNDVGKVHLGVVHIFECEKPDVEPNEAEICETGFVPVSELLADIDRFETWSQICLRELYG